jgi:hypothetical protein
MIKLLDRKGQFSIIAAVLVSIVLVTALITTYSIIRNNPLQDRPQILGAISEMNTAVSRILEFAVGYYGSILQVTGNTTYAKLLASKYLQSSFDHIAYTHPDWSPTIQITHSRLAATWFNKTSTSQGVLNITYSLMGLGISDIQYSTSAGLRVTVNPSNTSHVLATVTRDGDAPYPSLNKNSFLFYNYSYEESTWKLSNEGLTINSITSTETCSTYNITVPSGIDPSAYMLQVVDLRGIRVTGSTFSHYRYALNWNSVLYSSLSQDTIVVEALQNGSLRWLGQNLQFSTTSRPIPPIPAKAFHVNQTVNGITREVPFQIEDWGSNYRVPAGLTGNASLFSSRQMIVFLINHHVDNVILWWDGRDIANQTSYASTNRYFTGDNPGSRTLTNGLLTLTFSSSGFTATSSLVGSSLTTTASFLRVNGENPVYGASPAYIIHHGIVRDIVQQEAEWSGGIAGCPNVYAQIVLTLPANATYYTYSLRPIFVDSLQSRTITELVALRLAISNGHQLTENATSGGYPVASNATGPFYNFSSPTGWAHHWSEFVSEGAGAGMIFTDAANRLLYFFDDVAGEKTGALNIISSGRVIELAPIKMVDVAFQYGLDLIWHGAVVSFDGTDPIYRSADSIGLWAIVEAPPTVTATPET